MDRWVKPYEGDPRLALPLNAILVVEVGSTAHGTGLPGGEDFDECCVVVESPVQVLGIGRGLDKRMQRTQPDHVKSGPGDVDRQVYSLRRFLLMAVHGNPSILLALWAPVLGITEIGEGLRALSDAFVGPHIIPRFRGYMRQQALRLVGLAGNQGHGPHRPELVAAHGYDTKYAMHAARLGFQCIELLETGKLVLPIPGEPGDWLRAVRRGEVPFEAVWDRLLGLDSDLAWWEPGPEASAGPDVDRIEQFSCDAHELAWSGPGRDWQAGAWLAEGR